MYKLTSEGYIYACLLKVLRETSTKTIFDKEFDKDVNIKQISEMAEDLYSTCDNQQKEIAELQDKLHRRNMQIKELKKRLNSIYKLADAYLNDRSDNIEPASYMEQIIKYTISR